jgi:hypothetical protein
MNQARGSLSGNIKGVDGVLDSKWSFSVADNDYREVDPIKIQANGEYSTPRSATRAKCKYCFALVFRCAKKGGRLKLDRIVIRGELSGQTRGRIRGELEVKFKYLKKLNIKLL